MEINIVTTVNPFFYSSASANRWLSLIEGLTSQGAIIKLFFNGGYLKKEEKEKYGVKGFIGEISYEYVFPILVEGYWTERLFTYLLQDVLTRGLIYVLTNRLKDTKGVIWLEMSGLNVKLAIHLKRNYPYLKLFSEMSEYLDIHKNNKGNVLQRWKGDVRQLLFEKHGFYALDGLALMTRTLLKHYKNFHLPHPKFLHLPMTVDIERFEHSNHSLAEFQPPYIAFVGVMNDAKDGVSILIKAFYSLVIKYPNHKLYLVGGWNHDTGYHLELIQTLGLEKKVFWMKEYPRDQIPNIICNADLLVLPRPDSKQARGGFPTKLGEYLATGRPICATRVGEIPDYLVDNESVFFANPGDVESFAEAMLKALSDKKNAERIGLNGSKIAKQEFSKDIQAIKLYKFLEQL